MFNVPFIDRKREMETLSSLKSGLGIVYGRRRIGKTRLLLEFLKKRKGVFWEAFVGNYQELSKSFAESVRRELGIYVPYDIVEALKLLNEKDFVVVLDEFQYLADSDPSVTSKLKQLVDKGLNYPLILSGSSVSFVEKELLGSSSPLFGRRSLQLKLKPLPFYYAKRFWEMDWESSLYAYSMIGGTPAYLSYTYSATNPEEVIRSIFTYGSPLLEEGELLFHEESFKRPETYKRIMRALAKGYNSPSKLANACNLDARSIYYYLEILERLDLVRTIIPMGRRKGAIIEIVDNYFNFYYSTVVELKGAAEAGVDVTDDVKERLEAIVPKVFERVVEESLPLLFKMKVLKTKPVEVGKWWYKGEEIDLVVRDESSATFIEVKWAELDKEEVSKIKERLLEKARKSGLMKENNYFLVVCKRCEGGVELLRLLEEAERKGLEL